MNQQIKAIETVYGNCRFRSRLEARYAVFFDFLGVKWSYETEGYKLPSGCYLPDFWLLEMNLWAEIKPTPPSDLEKKLCEELAGTTGSAAAIFFGLPCENPGMVYCFDSTDSTGGEQWWDEVSWAIDRNARDVCLNSHNDSDSRAFSALDGSAIRVNLARDCDADITTVTYAAMKAAHARFEYGGAAAIEKRVELFSRLKNPNISHNEASRLLRELMEMG